MFEFVIAASVIVVAGLAWDVARRVINLKTTDLSRALYDELEAKVETFRSEVCASIERESKLQSAQADSLQIQLDTLGEQLETLTSLPNQLQEVERRLNTRVVADSLKLPNRRRSA